MRGARRSRNGALNRSARRVDHLYRLSPLLCGLIQSRASQNGILMSEAGQPRWGAHHCLVGPVRELPELESLEPRTPPGGEGVCCGLSRRRFRIHEARSWGSVKDWQRAILSGPCAFVEAVKASSDATIVSETTPKRKDARISKSPLTGRNKIGVIRLTNSISPTECSIMAQAKQPSKRYRAKTSLPVLGAAGVSLAVAGGASATAPTANVPSQEAGSHTVITLSEEEISDVNLATFYVFDKEDARASQAEVQQAVWVWRRGWRACRACRACRCGGCRACGGCGCGCGGCS